MTWNHDDPQGDEAAKCRWDVVPYIRGTGLDIGCGPTKVLPHAVGIDSCKDVELFGLDFKPDVVCKDACDLNFIEDASQDFVFSSHLLEHIEDYQAALREWWRVLKVGGHLCLYLPHRDLYPRIGTFGANPDHKHDFREDDIIDGLEDIGAYFDIKVNERRNAGQEYSFLQVFEKCGFGVHRISYDRPRPMKSACVVRYAGGIGDVIQASGILPALKREGYHVTVMTTPKGQDLLRHDPHIDDWVIQDNDEVPNHMLSDYWAVWEKKYDRFINLCESVEGTLLAIPGRSAHKWPDNLRRFMLNHNYGEFVAAIADLPYHSEAKFYPTNAEQLEADRYVHNLRRGKPVFSILWAMAGSSVHKAYPHMDDVIANVLAAMPEAAVIFVGDEVCQILEAGWEDNPRVHRRSGKTTIRQDLTLAQRVACVVGPETGVLNSVAFEPVAKVVMLSHSSPFNLTHHWVNTTSLVATPDDSVPCKNIACHRLHYGWDHCSEHKPTGTASCQVAIEPRRAFDAILDAYLAWKEEQHGPSSN